MVRRNMDVEDRKIYKGTTELIKEAKEKGVSPCELCRLKESNCGAVNCYSWYVWFSEKWQNIKEAARMKGYRV